MLFSGIVTMYYLLHYLLLTKLALGHTGRISALSLSGTDLASHVPYFQELGPIFSQFSPCNRFIRFIYATRKLCIARISDTQISALGQSNLPQKMSNVKERQLTVCYISQSYPLTHVALNSSIIRAEGTVAIHNDIPV